MNEKEVIGTLLMENIQLKRQAEQMESVIKQLHSQLQEKEDDVASGD